MSANTTVYTPGTLPQQVMALGNRFDIMMPEIATQVVTAIEALIVPGHTILSFDIFDTILLRNHRSELTRFVEVSAEVAAYLSTTCQRPIGQYDVLFGRLLANRLSYRLSPAREGCREGTIADIYRVTLMQLQIDATDEVIAACIEIELAYEVTQLTVNQPLMDMIQRHVERGGRAIYISDMYLSATHINQLLSRLGVDVALFAATYSSADVILSKRSGKIWPWLCAELSVSAHDILHIGDSLVSDYQSPRMHGAQAVHLPIPLQMRRDIMIDHGHTVHQLEALHLPIQGWMASPHW